VNPILKILCQGKEAKPRLSAESAAIIAIPERERITRLLPVMAGRERIFTALMKERKFLTLTMSACLVAASTI